MNNELNDIVEFSKNRFRNTFSIICKLAFLTHLALLFFFAIINVYEMAIYNVFSSVFFVLAVYLIKNKKNINMLFILCCVEVIAHAFLATYFVGQECNFIFFFFVLPPLFLLIGNRKILDGGLFFLSIGLCYCINVFLFKNYEPIYELNYNLIFAVNLIVVFTGFFMIFVIVFYNSKQVNVHEKEIIEVNNELFIKNENKNLIIKEIHHRIKGNLQVVISLLRLQAAKIDDHAVVEMFKNTQQRIFSMALLHENLLQEYALEVINAQTYFKFLTENLIKTYKLDNTIKVEFDIEDIDFGMQTLTPLGLIVNEVVTNSLKYAFKEAKSGEISLKLRAIDHKKYQLEISDNGSDTRNTKNTSGIGTKLISIFVKQLNGTVVLNQANGTSYTIEFEEIEHT